jgi:hypothetical protein
MFIADFAVFLLTTISWTSFSGDLASDNNIEFLSTVIAIYLMSFIPGTESEHGAAVICRHCRHQFQLDHHRPRDLYVKVARGQVCYAMDHSHHIQHVDFLCVAAVE